MVPEVNLHTFASAHADGAFVIDGGAVPHPARDQRQVGGRGRRGWTARGLPVIRGAQENVA